MVEFSSAMIRSTEQMEFQNNDKRQAFGTAMNDHVVQVGWNLWEDSESQIIIKVNEPVLQNLHISQTRKPQRLHLPTGLRKCRSRHFVYAIHES